MSQSRQYLPLLICFLSLFFITIQPLWAADIRAVYGRVAAELEESQENKKALEAGIHLQRDRLKQQLKEMQFTVTAQEKKLQQQRSLLEQHQQEYAQLLSEQASDAELMNNLAASVRVSAKQLQELLIRSPRTSLDRQLPESLDPILNADYFPGLDDMEQMANLFLLEMEQVGEVSVQTMPIVDPSGLEKEAPVLLVGPFLAAYLDQGKPHLLRYDSAMRSLVQVDAKLPWNVSRTLKSYLQGENDSVPLDLSAGAALEQLVRKKSFVDRVRAGGVLVWPILALAVIAFLIGLERAFFLKRVHDNTDRTMGEVNNRAIKGDWGGCQKLVQGRKKSPVYNVVRAGLKARHEGREVLESVLQEAILKELPRLERALPLLNIMAAVAPLMGLLGTVTGMIGTFEVINIYGTGDPRMMSGGISVALVTTMLGLMVAIPIMLMHAFLSRQVEHIVGDMEEKAVALTNIIYLHGKNDGVCPHVANP
ncbi:biopolymer transport protein ExbB [Desulfuromusa kysingii]|uniref:Biopolymer transport protein ExbB n=1 Tax=Desulfuromusa kysingii TaxID=37625 RepID=A0A1H3VUQ8_9BACT|nr:MotA/TolQ/ExbB proton channel family protein [Desulfuromusa kysingii]SDZ77852.1 biopolymer transport protein ExbB [Desulfuromusa kysingii]